MTSMVKCAVVGVGYLGTFHAQKYKKISETHPEVELVGVYDAVPEQAERVARELGVKVFSSLEDVKKEVQAVTLAVSTKAHFEVAQFFIENGISVNVEKPMTSTLAEAEALAKLVDKMNGNLSVGHIERFNPSVLELKRLLENPIHFEFKRLGPFRARGADVNVLYDLMIHDMDLALWLTGSEPESLIASGSRLLSSEWDTCQVALKMKNGMRVSIEVSRVCPTPQRSIKVTQALSVLSANTGTHELTEVMAAVHPHHHQEVGPIGATPYQTTQGQPAQKINEGELLAVRSWTVEKKDALLEETRAFLHSLAHNLPMPVSADEGVRAMKWTAAVEKELVRKLMKDLPAAASSVMIVAAEASSAAFAARILESWNRDQRNIQAFGVGSLEMENLGFERLGKSEEMAVVGAAEIITHYKHLKSVFDRLVEEAARRRPRVVIVMDYPEFNLMLSKKIFNLGIPVVYYISPQIWAWRQGRVKTIQKYCRKVFLLFPFEKKFYDKHNVNSEFVGHPVLDELDPFLYDETRRLENRRRCGIEDKDIVLGLMPGSRRLELKQHFGIQLEVARILMRKHSEVKLLILCAPSFSREDLLPYLEDFGFPYIIQKDDPLRMINLTDLVLVASGTATLMVGLLKKPMVIMYKMKWLTGWIARILVRGTKFFGLVNLILDREVVPERWQDQATPEILSQELDKFLTNSAYRDQVIRDLSQLTHCLGEKGATERVVKSLNEFLGDDEHKSQLRNI